MCDQRLGRTSRLNGMVSAYHKVAYVSLCEAGGYFVLPLSEHRVWDLRPRHIPQTLSQRVDLIPLRGYLQCAAKGHIYPPPVVHTYICDVI